MKKILSIMVTALMVLSMFSVVSADTINVPVKADIKVKAITGSYTDNIADSVTVLPKINAKAILDMSNVRNIVSLIGSEKASKYTELKTKGYVKADIIVTITYSNELTIDPSQPNFSYLTEGNTETFIYNESSSRPEGTDTNGNKTITFNLSTNEIALNDLIDSETPAENGAVTVTANGKLDDIVLSNDAYEITVPEFDKEYKISGTIVCDANIYTKETPDSTTKTDYRTYKFTGEDAATIKYTKPSSIGTGSSSTTKLTVKSSVPSGDIPAGTKVKLTSSISSAKIYYTTDGTDPAIDANGNLLGTTKLYSGEISLTEDTTIKYFASNGKIKSGIATNYYTVKGVDVSVSLKSGVVKPGTEINISSKNGKDIYYTTDGTDPAIDENGNPLGTTKKYTEPLIIDSDTTIKAIAVNEDGTVSVVASETYTVAPELTGEHIAYIQGYPDGEFKADMPITRAEVAEIFSRLTVKKMNVETDSEVSFTDVSKDAWYYNSVAFMEKSGIITGYEDGTFRPDNYITRAEFATMASRFDRLEDINENIFSDVTSLHWAYSMVNSAYTKGWINGYPNDTKFYPDNKITRAEAVTIVNRMTGRHAEEEFKDADLTGFTIFSDVENINMHWSFYDVVESSNTHDYN